MADNDQLTWGRIKKFMEDNNVPDDANIYLEVEIEGIKPTLTANGWVNGIERNSVYSIFLRHSPK